MRTGSSNRSRRRSPAATVLFLCSHCILLAGAFAPAITSTNNNGEYTRCTRRQQKRQDTMSTSRSTRHQPPTALHVQPIVTDPSPGRYDDQSPEVATIADFASLEPPQLESPTVGSIGNGAAGPTATGVTSGRPAGNGVNSERFMKAMAQQPAGASGVGSGGRVTLTRFLQDMVQERPELRGMDLPLLSVQMACKTISNLVNRAGINQPSPPPSTGAEQADLRLNSMKRLDQLSTNVLRNALRFTGKLKIVAQSGSTTRKVEKEADTADGTEGNANGGGDNGDGPDEHQPGVVIAGAIDGKYVACFDPLDGSGNADAAICTGTVFGLFENLEKKKEMREKGGNGGDQPQFTLTKHKNPEALARSVLQPGKNLVGAGYCLYSSATILVFTLAGGEVNGFTLDPQSNEFILTHPNIRIPPRGNVYSCNEANSEGWDEDFKAYLKALKTGDNETGKPYALRYVGSMVGDIHRTLMYGGIFCYPGDSGRHPKGNLQLLYKSSPMAHIICAAGGMATDGKRNLLDLEPKRVHERSPCFIGSPDDIMEMKQYIKHDE